MARYTGPVCRLCRREGEKLYLKGTRCVTPKCAIDRRNQRPGQHFHRRSKLSDYGLQLREKQKAKRVYGVLEKAFRAYFKDAEKKKGITGENLLGRLETRLDSVVYRLGLAASRNQARQLIRHNHFLLNDRKVNIPSMQVQPGDTIEVRQRSRSKKPFKLVVENGVPSHHAVPEWLESDLVNLKGSVVRLPQREEIAVPINDKLIVELYSK